MAGNMRPAWTIDLFLRVRYKLAFLRKWETGSHLPKNISLIPGKGDTWLPEASLSILKLVLAFRLLQYHKYQLHISKSMMAPSPSLLQTPSRSQPSSAPTATHSSIIATLAISLSLPLASLSILFLL